MVVSILEIVVRLLSDIGQIDNLRLRSVGTIFCLVQSLCLSVFCTDFHHQTDHESNIQLSHQYSSSINIELGTGCESMTTNTKLFGHYQITHKRINMHNSLERMTCIEDANLSQVCQHSSSSHHDRSHQRHFYMGTTSKKQFQLNKDISELLNKFLTINTKDPLLISSKRPLILSEAYCVG